MKELSERIAQNKYARMAGLMYLPVIAVFVTGLFLRSSVEKSGNFIDSSHRIASSEHIYRIGVSVQLSTMLLRFGWRSAFTQLFARQFGILHWPRFHSG